MIDIRQRRLNGLGSRERRIVWIVCVTDSIFSNVSYEKPVDYFELGGLFDQFRSLCSKTSVGPNYGITKGTFETCLGPVAAEKNLILDRIYTFFDQDKDDLISFDEFVRGLSVLAKGNFDERVYREFFLAYV